MPGSLSGEVCASHHQSDLMQKTGQFNARYNLATAVQYAEHFVRYGFDAITVVVR